MVKTYNVTLINKQKGINKTIRVSENDYILDIAEQKGMNLPVSCRAGVCVTCAGRLIKGKVEQDHDFLKPNEIESGFVLTCRSYPRSDCTIVTHQEDELLDL